MTRERLVLSQWRKERQEGANEIDTMDIDQNRITRTVHGPDEHQSYLGDLGVLARENKLQIEPMETIDNDCAIV